MFIFYLKVCKQSSLEAPGKAHHTVNNFLEQKYYASEEKAQLLKYIYGLTSTISDINDPRSN